MLEKSQGSPKLLFLPIEVFSREFHGRILIAAEAVKRGYTVFVGHKPSVEQLALKMGAGGVILWKNIPNTVALKMYLKLQQAGVLSIAQDEEAGITYQDYADFYNSRPSLSFVHRLSGFLCWSEREYDFLTSAYQQNGVDIASKLVMTGGSRASLWGELGNRYFGKEVGENRKRFGDYVVFSSNFPNAIPPLRGRGRRKFMTEVGDFSKPEVVAQERKNVELFLDGIHTVLQVTELCVVIRPHPSEHPDFWKKKFCDNPRVFVVDGGDPNSLLFASKALVHNSSTMAYHAIGAGPAIIALHAEFGGMSSAWSMANGISEIASDPNELVSLLSRSESIARSQALASYQLESVVAGRGHITNIVRIMNFVDSLTDDSKPGVRVPAFARARVMFSGYALRAFRLLPRSFLGTRKKITLRKIEFFSRTKVKYWLERASECVSLESSILTKSFGGLVFRVELKSK